MSSQATAPDPESRETNPDGLPYLMGGFVLGALAALGAAMGFAVALAVVQQALVVDACGEGLPAAAIIILAVVSLVLLVCGALWLLHMRRWIGTKTDPTNQARINWMRKRFAIGSLGTYLVLSPAVWLITLALANCAGTQ